jgi:hypothetical protein
MLLELHLLSAHEQYLDDEAAVNDALKHPLFRSAIVLFM